MPIVAAVSETNLDFLEELRLRRWARENYCYADARPASWHPVIHDEMRRRDSESEDPVNSIVFEAEVEESVLEDEPSTMPTDSTILTDVPETQQVAAIEQHSAVSVPGTIGPIVPLPPDVPGLHGPHEIQPPHMRIGSPVEPAEMHYT